MNILHFNIVAMSLCCLLLVGGYALNQHKAGVVAMFVGVLAMLATIGINIYASLHGWDALIGSASGNVIFL